MAQDRFATVTTPLGDALQLYRMTGHEALGEPFEYELELFSTDPNLKESDLLGEHVTVNLELPDKSLRHFDGLATSFSYEGPMGRFWSYRATLRPWLWLLSQASDCRIFQSISVPDLVKKLFREHGFSEFDPRLSGNYPTCDYIVQYRETTLGFVNRLLEQEGIYYYFRHEAGQHTLVLADSIAAHDPQPGYESVPYFAPGNAALRDTDNIEHWTARRQIRTGKYAVTDFDFTNARANLLVQTAMPGDYAHASKEFYEYPGQYSTTSEGERYLRARMEQLQAAELGLSGHGNVRGLSAGVLFTLTEFPRDALNCQYLVVSASYTLEVPNYESASPTTGHQPFTCRLQAVDSKLPFVAPRLTPRPTVAGPQTATVVGKAGEEIWTDNYGRVKVQFHWDREGERDENSSCWVRVAQVWAGTRWGGIHIPRIGQEVIVDFLEGDPDRPIITGRVYNSSNMPPYELPLNRTQSGIKSQSTKDASIENFNELRFEDLKGEEQVFLQAEKDLSEKVKNDHHTHVGANQSNDVVKDHSESIGGEQSLKVTGNRTVHIDGSESVTIGGSKAADGVSGSKVNVTGDHKFDASKTINIQAPVSIKLECGGSSILIEPSKISIIAGGQAVMVLDTAALVQAAAGAKLQLDTSAIAQAALGAQLTLDANALLEGMQSTVSGRVLAQTVAGASSVTASPAGVALTGVPMVKIN